VLLRVGQAIRSAEFVRLVNIDQEFTRHLLSANCKALHVRTAARLALPDRSYAPSGVAFCGIVPNAFDQGQQGEVAITILWISVNRSLVPLPLMRTM